MVDYKRWRRRLSLLVYRRSLPFSASFTSYTPVVPRLWERDEHSGKLADRLDCERAAQQEIGCVFTVYCPDEICSLLTLWGNLDCIFAVFSSCGAN